MLATKKGKECIEQAVAKAQFTTASPEMKRLIILDLGSNLSVLHRKVVVEFKDTFNAYKTTN